MTETEPNISENQDPDALRFKFDICAVENLGEKLYNSLPPILTELVANAWDAEAENVTIKLLKGNEEDRKIIIEDDGFGMSREDVKNKYLTIGKKKREVETDDKTSNKQRSVMGRKGIGKLAVFAVADEITVETCRKMDEAKLEKTAFYIDYNALTKRTDGKYEPKEEGIVCSLTAPGTLITLNKLKKSRIMTTAIKQSIARSLPVIFLYDDFKVKVDDYEIKLEDRDVFEKLEAIWFFGDETKLEKIKNSISTINEKKEENNKILVYNIFPTIEHTKADKDGEKEISIPEGVYGWFGTAKNPNLLKNKETETTLNEVSIIARGKMAEQNVLSEIGKTDRMIISYLTGEIYADFLDESGKKDIATSSRQSLDRDDIRTKELFEWGKAAMRIVKNNWDDLREKKVTNHLYNDENFKQRIEILDKTSQNRIKKFLGILSRSSAGDDKIKELADSLISAFEYRHFHDIFEGIDENKFSNDAEALVKILEQIKEWKVLEGRAILEIIKGRIDIIDKCFDMIADDAPETSNRNSPDNFHDLLANYPWIIDPDWQMLSEEGRMTERLKEHFNVENIVYKRDANYAGRFDFLAVGNENKLIVIEIKRPKHDLELEDIQQLERYAGKLRTATTRDISQVIIYGGGTGADINIDELKSRKNLTLIELRKLTEKSSKAYKEYRAVLEKTILHKDFITYGQEVAKTKAVMNSGTRRSAEDRKNSFKSDY